jgi:hypothetical protein
LGLAFFGLNSNNVAQARVNLFKNIHQIVFHGNGGYDWLTVYNMPNWLRHFTFHEIQEWNKPAEEKENTSVGGTKTAISADGTIKTPEFLQQVHETRKTTYK